jgi:hypothetical protein
MFLYKVASVLISDSVLSMPQSFGQSFASASFTDPSGRLITKTAYSEQGIPDLEIGLLPPLFSGEYNGIDTQVLRGFPEPIIIIKPPPFTRKTTSYTTAFTTTKRPVTTTSTTTKAPATVRATTAFVPRTTQTPRVFTRPPTQANNSRQQQQGSSFTGAYRSNSEEGKYRPVGNDGTYRPKKNEGAYIHNNAGAYKHSNSGAYKPDDRGKYRGN